MTGYRSPIYFLLLLCALSKLAGAQGVVTSGAKPTVTDRRPVSFLNDVEPILTRAACNQGACQSVVMAGGGVRGGQVYGRSDRAGAYPTENPVTPGDLGATIYSLLGISPDTELRDQQDRPHPLVRGEAIQALF